MIKNTLRTAVAYAHAKAEPLGARHVLAIIQTELKQEDDTLTPTEKASAERIKQALTDLERLIKTVQT